MKHTSKFCSSNSDEYWWAREQFVWASKNLGGKAFRDPYKVPRSAPKTKTMWDEYAASLGSGDESVTVRRLEDVADDLRKGSAGDPDSDQRTLEHVEKLGINTITPDPWERFENLEGRENERKARADVRSLIGRKLRRHYELAREGETRDIRHHSATFLKTVGAILAGDLRGQRKGSAKQPVKIAHAYYCRLFDLRNAEKHLRCDCLAGKSQRQKILSTAKAFGIPEGRFREYLNADENGVIMGRKPNHPARMVRIWIAQDHGITEQTISNYLTLGPVRERKGQSRK